MRAGCADQRLAIFDGLAVLDAYRFNDTGHISFNLVHHLHCLDDAQRVAFIYTIAYLYIRCRTGRRGGIKRSDHRRCDGKALFFSLCSRCCCGRVPGRRCGCWCGHHDRCRRSYNGSRRMLRITTDPHRFLSFGDLDFGDAGLIQKLNQFLYFSYVHHFSSASALDRTTCRLAAYNASS